MITTIVGLDLPPRHTHPDPHARLLQTGAWLKGGLPDSGQYPKPDRGTVAVTVDEAGNVFGIVPGTNGPMLLPWIEGSEIDADPKAAEHGGFVPLDAIDQLAQRTPPADPNGFSREFFQSLASIVDSMNLDVDTGLPREPRVLRSARQSSQPGPPGPAPETPAGQDPAAAATRPEKDDSFSQYLEDNWAQLTAQSAATALAKGLGDGKFAVTDLLGSGTSALFGAALGFATEKLFGPPPADTDGTAQWAMAILSKQFGMQALSLGNMGKVFGGTPGPYDGPALRAGDCDENGNDVLSGCPSVHIDGKGRFAAREGDAVGGDGIKVIWGARTVFIGGKPAGRLADGDSSWSRAAQFKPYECRMATTTIGGVTTNPDPPVPPEVEDQYRKARGECGGKPLDPKQIPTYDPTAENPSTLPPEGEVRIYQDANGEYRIWDGYGWSSTPGEFSNLPDWGGFGGIFRAGNEPTPWNSYLSRNLPWLFTPEKPGNWYLLGGLIDLGAPYFPGAGTGSIWFIPDKLFGFDMSSLYTIHDWLYAPDATLYSKDWYGWFHHWINVEWTSLQQISRHWPNPIGMLFHAAYSMATSLQGLFQWWSAYLDHLKGVKPPPGIVVSPPIPADGSVGAISPEEYGIRIPDRKADDDD